MNFFLKRKKSLEDENVSGKRKQLEKKNIQFWCSRVRQLPVFFLVSVHFFLEKSVLFLFLPKIWQIKWITTFVTKLHKQQNNTILIWLAWFGEGRSHLNDFNIIIFCYIIINLSALGFCCGRDSNSLPRTMSWLWTVYINP